MDHAVEVRVQGTELFVKVGCQYGLISKTTARALRDKIAFEICKMPEPPKAKKWVLHKNGKPYEGRHYDTQRYFECDALELKPSTMDSRPVLGDTQSSMCCTVGQSGGGNWEWIFMYPPAR